MQNAYYKNIAIYWLPVINKAKYLQYCCTYLLHIIVTIEKDSYLKMFMKCGRVGVGGSE